MRARAVAVGLLVAFFAFEARAALASSHDVEITAPNAGATVEGTVLLRARTTGTVTSVEFSWAPDAGGPWTLIGPATPNSDGTVWTLQWNSDGIDGPVVVRATASDGTTKVTDAVNLVLDNRPKVAVTVAPNPFSPNGDGRRDTTTITVDSDEAGNALVEVVDAQGRVVRRWRAEIKRESDLVIRWNGRADRRTLPDGRYRIRAVVTDDAGLTGRDSDSVVIDTRAPRVRWLGVSPEPLREHDRVRFSARIRDRGPVRLLLLVEDRTSVVGRRRDTVRPGDRTIRWWARYDRGGGKLFPGQYSAELVATDRAGNRRRSSEIPWRVHRDVRARVYTSLPGAGRRVALTFDDCFNADAWQAVLGALRARRVDATFFCNGGAAARARWLIRQTVRQGHVYGSHTWDHMQLTSVSASGTTSRILRDAALSWRVARYTTAPYFRPPYGSWDADVVAGARAASHPRVILWDVDPRDWTNPGVGTIVSRSVRPARGGSIIVLHTLPQTASAVPRIITGLRRKGLRPVTIAEMFKAAGYRSG